MPKHKPDKLEPGPNPLFVAVVADTLLSSVAGIASHPKPILRSSLISKLTVALAVFVFFYLVIAVLWLAWHRKTVSKITVPGGGADLPDATDEKIQDEADKRADEINVFMSATADALSELSDRVDALEDEATDPAHSQQDSY